MKPLRLHITLSPSEELLALRRENEDLRQELDRLRSDFKRNEYRFACESILNNKLIDLCRESGIEVPKTFFNRPY